jgi:hypothetical protein
MTKKQTKQPAHFTVANCNFSSTPADAATVAAVTALATAAAENAKAIQAAAAMLKAPDALLKING